jgi:hypothetical protein
VAVRAGRRRAREPSPIVTPSTPQDWRRDPDAALDDFEAHVRGLFAEVLRGAVQAIGADPGARVAAPTPGHLAVAPALAGLSPRERTAMFATLELSLRRLEAGALATLRGHRAQLDAFLAERAARQATRSGAAQLPLDPAVSDKTLPTPASR